MSWSGFGDLDLSGIQGETGSARLREGSYRVKCMKAEISAKEGSKDRGVSVEMVCQDGHGDIRHIFNVHHQSEQAQEIGLRQLKGFLEVSGHPNPDRPGDVASLVGLECVIVVGMGRPWTDRDGKSRQNTEIKKFMPKDAPVAGPAATSAVTKRNVQAAPAGGVRPVDLGDEIPF
jgi:hypothetical protein